MDEVKYNVSIIVNIQPTRSYVYSNMASATIEHQWSGLDVDDGALSTILAVIDCTVGNISRNV